MTNRSKITNRDQDESTAASRFISELKGLIEETYAVHDLELQPAEIQSIEIVADLLTSKNSRDNTAAFRAMRIKNLQDPMIRQVKANERDGFGPLEEDENGIRPSVLVATYLLAKTRQLHYKQKIEDKEKLTHEQQRYLGLSTQVLDTLNEVIGKSQLNARSEFAVAQGVNSELYNDFQAAYAHVSQHLELPENATINNLRPHALQLSEAQLQQNYTASRGASAER